MATNQNKLTAREVLEARRRRSEPSTEKKVVGKVGSGALTGAKAGAGVASDFYSEPRPNHPSNYKLHVLTALSLALAIRIAALGTKAVTG